MPPPQSLPKDVSAILIIRCCMGLNNLQILLLQLLLCNYIIKNNYNLINKESIHP